jgi:hypothetical protein
MMPHNQRRQLHFIPMSVPEVLVVLPVVVAHADPSTTCIAGQLYDSQSHDPLYGLSCVALPRHYRQPMPAFQAAGMIVSV